MSLVTLGVKDLQKSIAFYRDGLGWKTEVKEGDGVAFFQLSGIILSLFPRQELAKDAGMPAEGSGFPGITLAHNVGSEAEVDEVLRVAVKAGAKLQKPAQKVYWGGYSGYFADPDGHLWEVAHNPFWKLTEDGRALLR
jgi:catechol 2,3-dioxygenase-like lactoylglutathione lyase family enzyme